MTIHIYKCWHGMKYVLHGAFNELDINDSFKHRSSGRLYVIIPGCRPYPTDVGYRRLIRG